VKKKIVFLKKKPQEENFFPKKKMNIFFSSFFIVIAILLALGFLFFVVHIGLQYHKRCVNDVYDLMQDQIPFITSNNNTIPMRFLPSSTCIHTQMFELIRKARKEVIFCTYRWRFDKDPDTRIIGHLSAIGAALRELDQSGMKIHVKILSNQMPLGGETDYFVKKQFQQTICYWNLSSNITVEFRTWRHVTLGNIHDKFVVVDRKECLIHSMNVEAASHGREGTWRECGVSFSSDEEAKRIYDHFEECFLQGVEYIAGEEVNMESVVPVKLEPLLSPNLTPVFQVAHLQVKFLMPDVFSTTRNNALTLHLARLLRSARKSIDILTPNFNDIALLEACEHVPTRILFSKQFNVDVPWIQELLLGWSTNERMKRQFASRDNIQVRWNAEDDDPILGKNAHALHAKLYLIDREWLATGSVNADVYSTITSGECLVSARSKDIVDFATKECFEPWWKKGIDFVV